MLLFPSAPSLCESLLLCKIQYLPIDTQLGKQLIQQAPIAQEADLQGSQVHRVLQALGLLQLQSSISHAMA